MNTFDRRTLLKAGGGAVVAGGTLPWLLSACSGGSSTGGERAKTVMIDIDGGRVTSPKLWNPFVPGARVDQGMLHMIEPMFILNFGTSKVQPWLAESCPSNDKLDVWTLNLRPGVKWSDGEDFDADDVVFTFSMLLHGSAQLTNAAAIQEWVDAIEKKDNRTVVFRLKKVNPRFQLDYIAAKTWYGIPVVPEHIWKGKDPLKFDNYDPAKGWPVFTGPWTLSSVSPTQFVYERHDKWWGKAAGFKPLPKPQRLIFVGNSTEEVRASEAQRHQLDAVMDITTGAFQSIKSRNPNIISWRTGKPYSWPDPCTRLLSVNNTVDPWGDKDMRWALNYAINRDEVVKIAYEGSTTPARFFFPPYTPLEGYVNLLQEKGLFDKYPITQHDPDKAKHLIESKGYRKKGNYYERGGKQLSLSIITSADFIEIQRIAQTLIGQLQQVGINATSRALSGSAFGYYGPVGKFEAYTDWSACGSVTEPYSSMQLYMADWVVPVGKQATSNFVRWKNDEYTGYVKKLGNLPIGDPKIKDYFVKAAEIWLRELPFIPVTYAKKLYSFDTTYWTGWPTTDDNYIQPPTGWQSAHEIIHNLKPARKGSAIAAGAAGAAGWRGAERSGDGTAVSHRGHRPFGPECHCYPGNDHQSG